MANNPAPILETDRLVLRELNQGDAGSLFLLNSDPEVMRYTGDFAYRTVRDAERAILTHSTQYTRYGVGRWALIEKDSGSFIGWCGLKYAPDVDEHDIGFRIFRAQWNRGFATEAARACIDYGLVQLNLGLIVGRAMKLNTASIRVLSKVGLTYWKDDACGNAEGVIYKIEKVPGTAGPNAC